jgi:hypothetical protein
VPAFASLASEAGAGGQRRGVLAFMWNGGRWAGLDVSDARLALAERGRRPESRPTSRLALLLDASGSPLGSLPTPVAWRCGAGR